MKNLNKNNNYDFIKVIQDIKTPEQKAKVEKIIFKNFDIKAYEYMLMLDEIAKVVYNND